MAVVKRILCIEDEVKLARFIELELKYEGYHVDVANDGVTGITMFKAGGYDMVLLDLMLPGADGMEVLKEIRQASGVPVIMLTAKDRVTDKVAGLDSGADDYITKPFAIEEVLARMRAAFNKGRPRGREEGLLWAKSVVIDVRSRIVTVNGFRIELTKTEYELLVFLVTNKNIVLTRDQILSQVWGYDYFGETNIVDVYIRYLRAKIDDKFNMKLIFTVRGVGYAVKDED